MTPAVLGLNTNVGRWRPRPRPYPPPRGENTALRLHRMRSAIYMNHNRNAVIFATEVRIFVFTIVLREYNMKTSIDRSACSPRVRRRDTIRDVAASPLVVAIECSLYMTLSNTEDTMRRSSASSPSLRFAIISSISYTAQTAVGHHGEKLHSSSSYTQERASLSPLNQ